MKTKQLFIFVVATLFMVGCSNEEEIKVEENNPAGWINRVGISMNENATRTIHDGLSVTWAAGDKIGIVGTKLNSSHRTFSLISGSNTNDAVFEADSPQDYLGAGEWIAYYPHTASQYTRSNKLYMNEIIQNGENNNHLAEYDWLMSSPQTATENTSLPGFKMDHLFALIKITVRLATPTSHRLPLDNIVFVTNDRTQSFANAAFIDDVGVMEFDYESSGISITRSDYPRLDNGDTHTFWMLEKKLNHPKPKTLYVFVYFRNASKPTFGISTTFTPSDSIYSGCMYNLDLVVPYNDASYNTSTL